MARFKFKPRKLSTLLKEGSKKLKRQTVGQAFTLDKNGDLCGCAIGAIALATGYDPLTKRGKLKVHAEDRAYIIVNKILATCGYPVKTDVASTSSIYSRNDTGYSFEALANWLARQERLGKISCRNKSEVSA